MDEELKVAVKDLKISIKRHESLKNGLEVSIRSARTILHVLKPLCALNQKEGSLQLIDYHLVVHKSALKLVKELECISSQFSSTMNPFIACYDSLRTLLKEDSNNNKLYIEILRLITERFNKVNGPDILSDSLFSTNIANFVLISLSRIAEEVNRHIKDYDRQIYDTHLKANGYVNKSISRADNPSQFSSFTKKTSNKKDYLGNCIIVESKLTHRNENGSIHTGSKENYNNNIPISRFKALHTPLRTSASKESFFVKNHQHKRELSLGATKNQKPREDMGLFKDSIKDVTESFRLDQTLNIAKTPNKSSKKSVLSKKITEEVRLNLLSSSNTKKNRYVASFKDHIANYYDRNDSKHQDSTRERNNRNLDYNSGLQEMKKIPLNSLPDQRNVSYNDLYSPYTPSNNTEIMDKTYFPNTPNNNQRPSPIVNQNPLFFIRKNRTNN